MQMHVWLLWAGLSGTALGSDNMYRSYGRRCYWTMLTHSALKRLLDGVDHIPPFRQLDFEAKKDGRSTIIEYRHNAEFQFSIYSEDDSSGEAVRAVVSPGQWLEAGQVICKDFGSLQLEFRAWLERVLEEVRAAPISRMVFEQQEQIRKLAEEISQRWNVEDEKALFTPDEVSQLVTRLDQLEQQFADHIRATVEEDENVDQKIEALEQEIAFLKDTLHTTNRGGWISTFALRLLTWANESGNQKTSETGNQAAPFKRRFEPGL